MAYYIWKNKDEENGFSIFTIDQEEQIGNILKKLVTCNSYFGKQPSRPLRKCFTRMGKSLNMWNSYVIRAIIQEDIKKMLKNKNINF